MTLIDGEAALVEILRRDGDLVHARLSFEESEEVREVTFNHRRGPDGRYHVRFEDGRILAGRVIADRPDFRITGGAVRLHVRAMNEMDALLGADGMGAARPGARGSRVTASRYALGAEGGGAARPGAYMCSPRNCARCLLGGVGMSKTSCAARCSRGSVQGVLRAPAEGEGGVAHHENFSAAATATLERSGGTVAHGKRAARERRRRRSKVSRRRRAGRRAVGGACACRARSNGRRRPLVVVVVVVVVRAPTSNYLRLASPIGGSTR